MKQRTPPSFTSSSPFAIRIEFLFLIAARNELHRIFRMHRPDQCLLFDDALAVFTLRVNVRVVIKYRDSEVIA